MISNEAPLKVMAVIGATAGSAAVLAMSLNVKDWKLVSTSASLGCFLGGSYLEYGKPLFSKFFSK